MRNRNIIVYMLALLFNLLPAMVIGADYPQVLYHVEFKPKHQSAFVQISIKDTDWLSSALFQPLDHTVGKVSGNGKLKPEGDYIRWFPPAKNALLEYEVRLNIEKRGGGFDALVTDDWALLRGEDLFPSFRATKDKGAVAQAFIEFTLPPNWSAVNTGWPRISSDKYVIGNDDRAMPRPQGWLIAGDLGSRKERLGNTNITVSAPKGQNFRQMEALAFLGMVWPTLEDLFEKPLPKDILITGAADPMWRGGLSSPTSFYVHADRPLVSENGTSTHLHELMHVITGIHAKRGYDWIVEGLAEFYSVELLYRAGAYTTERREQIFDSLAEWGAKVRTLKRSYSYGEYTARAAVLFNELDRDIRRCSATVYNLDNVLNALVENDSVDLEDLKKAYQSLCTKPNDRLDSILVRGTDE